MKKIRDILLGCIFVGIATIGAITFFQGFQSCNSLGSPVPVEQELVVTESTNIKPGVDPAAAPSLPTELIKGSFGKKLNEKFPSGNKLVLTERQNVATNTDATVIPLEGDTTGLLETLGGLATGLLPESAQGWAGAGLALATIFSRRFRTHTINAVTSAVPFAKDKNNVGGMTTVSDLGDSVKSLVSAITLEPTPEEVAKTVKING